MGAGQVQHCMSVLPSPGVLPLSIIFVFSVSVSCDAEFSMIHSWVLSVHRQACVTACVQGGGGKQGNVVCAYVCVCVKTRYERALQKRACASVLKYSHAAAAKGRAAIDGDAPVVIQQLGADGYRACARQLVPSVRVLQVWIDASRPASASQHGTAAPESSQACNNNTQLAGRAGSHKVSCTLPVEHARSHHSACLARSKVLFAET